MINREALLVYLHDLRDLEAARYQIGKMRRNNLSDNKAAIQKMQSEINRVNMANYWENPERPKGYFSIMFVCGVMCFIGYLLGGEIWSGVPLTEIWLNEEYRMSVMVVVSGVLGVVIFGIRWLSEYKEYILNKQKVKKHNTEEKRRLEIIAPSTIAEKNKIIQEIIARGNSNENYLKNELQKVIVLLEEAYNQNILAKPYRNLPSVYYIYEYMSTSQASLEETIMHEHMEDGFQRIEKKLDMIIEQNEEIIFTSRQIEANSRKTVEQTVKMLNTLQHSLESQLQTEQNTLEIAQYAAICATYSRTTAYFSAADYLRKSL